MSDYIKLFDNKNQQDAFAESEDYTQPHISCTKGGGNLKYNNGSGGITADSITPELLENEDIGRKILNWGLSDEEISHLHTLHGIYEEFQSSIHGDEDLSALGNFSDFFLDGNEFQTDTSRYSNLLDEIQTLEEYKYLVYSVYGDFDIGGIVLKRNNYNKLAFESVDRSVIIFFREGRYCDVYIGADTF